METIDMGTFAPKIDFIRQEALKKAQAGAPKKGGTSKLLLISLAIPVIPLVYFLVKRRKKR